MKYGSHSTIGILGGTGKTGGQFARLFRRQGYRVQVTGSKTAHLNAKLLATCDILIFALPLSRAADLIRSLLKQATRKDQLLLDLSSLKEREVQAMMTAPGEVIGMHPLFGPSTDPRGERVILCPGRASASTLRSLRSILRSCGLLCSVMTPANHDDLMATVQVIPHLKSYLMADVLRRRKTDFSQVLKRCTPTYEMEFNVIGRFLDDHPDLYMPILFRNPQTVSILETLRDAVDECLEYARTGNLKAAEQRYTECQKSFRPHLARARRHSEACIRTLLSLSS